MNAPAKIETGAPAVQNETAAIISVIEAAARNPDVDVDKLDRLLTMQERIMDRQADQAFSEAMNAVQRELRPVAADASNPQTKSRYASYPALDNACRPVYTSHGFSLNFNTADGAPADCLRLVCKVRHSAGHTESYQVDMPADGKGAKGGDVMTKTHATGAAMSYGQRYLLKLIFNIAVGDDRDGNAPVEEPAAVAAAKAAIDACATLDALDDWAEKNAEAAKSFPPKEYQAIVRHHSARIKALREGAR